MNTQALKGKLAGKLTLPSLPEVIVKIQKMLHDPSVGMRELGEELASDPPLTARVLRVANSAYYSLSVPVLDISHAAAILGMDTMNTLLIQVGLNNVFESIEGADGHCDFDPRSLWKHSVFTAQLAAAYPARLYKSTSKEEMFVCGLLHDIGKFVLFAHLREEFLECTRRADNEGALHRIEKEVLGFTHADVGALVAERWGLPRKAVRAIGGHHDFDGLACTDQEVAMIALASMIASDLRNKRVPRLTQKLPADAVDCLELSEEELEQFLEHSYDLCRQSRAA